MEGVNIALGIDSNKLLIRIREVCCKFFVQSSYKLANYLQLDVSL